MRLLLVAVGLVVLIALGVLGMVLGEGDDSPGLQGIGGLLILGAIALAVRMFRRRRARPSLGP